MPEISCSFTTQCPSKTAFILNDSNESFLVLKARLRWEISNHINIYGVTTFVSGMTLGFDICAAETVLELKMFYPFIKLVCVLSGENKTESRMPDFRERYCKILGRADKIINMPVNCTQNYNEYMVDMSNYIVVICDGAPGENDNAVKYAHMQYKWISFINPEKIYL